MAISQGLTRGFHPTCETGSGLRTSFVDSLACGKAGSAAAFADKINSPCLRAYQSFLHWPFLHWPVEMDGECCGGDGASFLRGQLASKHLHL
jgi:hypothetical protein